MLIHRSSFDVLQELHLWTCFCRLFGRNICELTWARWSLCVRSLRMTSGVVSTASRWARHNTRHNTRPVLSQQAAGEHVTTHVRCCLNSLQVSTSQHTSGVVSTVCRWARHNTRLVLSQQSAGEHVTTHVTTHVRCCLNSLQVSTSQHTSSVVSTVCRWARHNTRHNTRPVLSQQPPGEQVTTHV